MHGPEEHCEAVKDGERQRPVASAWRPTFRAIVEAFVENDHALARGIAGVEPVPPPLARQIAEYVAGYGETLIELPEETWKTSASMWYDDHWNVLVDLWTAESGRSDMVLDARVFEAGDGFRFEIHLVYVP